MVIASFFAAALVLITFVNGYLFARDTPRWLTSRAHALRDEIESSLKESPALQRPQWSQLLSDADQILFIAETLIRPCRIAILVSAAATTTFVAVLVSFSAHMPPASLVWSIVLLPPLFGFLFPCLIYGLLHLLTTRLTSRSRKLISGAEQSFVQQFRDTIKSYEQH